MNTRNGFQELFISTAVPSILIPKALRCMKDDTLLKLSDTECRNTLGANFLAIISLLFKRSTLTVATSLEAVSW